MIELEKNYIQQRQFDQFVQEFIGDLQEPTKEEIDRFIGEIKTLERFTLDSKRFYVLFDHSKFYPAYISQNVEKEGGYSVDYILNQGLLFLFQRIHWKQLSLAYKVSKWGPRFQKTIGVHIPIIHNEVWCCGIKFKDKWKRWRTVILKQKILAATKENTPILSFIEAEEITDIYKADFAWYKVASSFQGKKVTRAYFSQGSKEEYNDILSAREIEILKLAVQQKNNQEISELLGISKNTVERHRKNMLARVGVTNMTALIRIAQIVKILE